MNGDTTDTNTAKLHMEWQELLPVLKNFLEGQKAQDVCIRYFAGENAVADAMLIASATSRRHAQGLADGVEKLCRDAGRKRPRLEGYESAQWILADCSDIIVHIFQEDIRELYRLEDLWNASPEKELAQ